MSWLLSDRSLPWRVAIGLAIFAVLAIVDYRKNREQATRWREYMFLLGCVGLAVAYGIANDLLTSRISVEYFLWGKGVAERVGGAIAAAPDAHRVRLDLEAIRIGTLATWSAGLIGGAALLFANSAGRRPSLPLTSLARLVPLMFIGAIGFGLLGGAIGWAGGWAWLSADFREMVADDQWRPYRFMAVFGIHLGGYVGALLGLIVAITRVVIRRRRSPQPEA